MSDRDDKQTLEQFIRGESGEGLAEVLASGGENLERPYPQYGGRCEKCTAPVGVICDYPNESPDCPIHAGEAKTI